MTTALRHPDPLELARAPLFASLTVEQLRGLAPHVEVEPFRTDQVLVSEGSRGYAFYVLRDGAAEVRRAAVPVVRLGPGDFFGALSVLGDGRRAATVVGAEPGVLWCLFGTALRVLARDHPEIAATIHTVAVQRGLSAAQ